MKTEPSALFSHSRLSWTCQMRTSVAFPKNPCRSFSRGASRNVRSFKKIMRKNWSRPPVFSRSGNCLNLFPVCCFVIKNPLICLVGLSITPHWEGYCSPFFGFGPLKGFMGGNSALHWLYNLASYSMVPDCAHGWNYVKHHGYFL